MLLTWRDSRVTLRRSGYQALRRLCLGMYYVDHDAQKAVGYLGPRRIPGLSFDDTTMGTRAWIEAKK